MWKKVRVGVLLYVLLMVGGGAWLASARTTDWDDTLWVSVYPINGDGSEAAAAYISSLDTRTFEAIPRFFEEQARHHGIALRSPIRLELGTTLSESPPEPPADRNPIRVAIWSLKLRYWAFRVDKGRDRVPADIEIFIKYFDPTTHKILPHSLGLQKGLMGIVNAFADKAYSASNNVVIAHELLHTVGATDKYDPMTNQPIYPHGFAEPNLNPLYPQSRAELMAGRIPLSKVEDETPRSLNQIVVGEWTAREIKWIE